MSSYYPDEPRSNFALYVLLTFIAGGLVVTGLMATQCSPTDPEVVKIDTEKEKLMMEASIKRLELEVKSWHSKFIDKVHILYILKSV